MADILKHVDILDLVNIVVTPFPNGNVGVAIEPLDRNKQAVIDEGALKAMNESITAQVVKRQSRVNDPNAIKFIEEYVGRMVSELHKNGLMELEDIPDAPDDPYANVRYNVRTH